MTWAKSHSVQCSTNRCLAACQLLRLYPAWPFFCEVISIVRKQIAYHSKNEGGNHARVITDVTLDICELVISNCNKHVNTYWLSGGGHTLNIIFIVKSEMLLNLTTRIFAFLLICKCFGDFFFQVLHFIGHPYLSK